MTPEELDNLLRPIPDWPKPGVTFRDIGPLLDDPKALMAAVAAMVAPWRETPIDVVAGAESRGFIFGTAIALALGVGFAPLRKPGKLPPPVSQVSYTLEYGEDQLEAAADAFTQRRVLLVDDVLATGGTLRAAAALVEQQQGVVVGRQYLAGNPHFGRPAVACPHADRKRPQLNEGRQRKRGPQGHHHHDPTHSTTLAFATVRQSAWQTTGSSNAASPLGLRRCGAIATATTPHPFNDAESFLKPVPNRPNQAKQTIAFLTELFDELVPLA